METRSGSGKSAGAGNAKDEGTAEAGSGDEWQERQSRESWRKTIDRDPLGKLKLCDAVLARFDAERDQASVLLAARRDELKATVNRLIKTLDPALILGDFHCYRLVLRLWGKDGLTRLERRCQVAGE